MTEDQIKQILTEQKSLGRTPEELLRMAQGAGVSNAMVIPLIVEMFPGFKQAPNQAKNTTPDASLKIWDPTGLEITHTRFEKHNGKIQKTYEYYQQHPYRARNVRRWFTLLGVAGTAALLSLAYFVPDVFWALMAGDDDSNGFGLFVVPWIPYAWYTFKIHRLQRDLVKKIIADKYHWVYNPEPRSAGWIEMMKKFPQIFQKGNKEQELEDEFWGSFKTAKQDRDFYSGIFHYAVERGSGKNRSVSHHYETVFAIRLNKVLKNALMLVPEKKSDRFWRSLGVGSDINVESAAFNEAFKVFKNGEPSQTELQSIFMKLTPAVQEQLVNLARENPKSSIYFAGDVFLFVREGLLFPTKKSFLRLGGGSKFPSVKMHTNFFEKVELDPRDEAYLQERFETLLSIAAETVKYLE